MKNVNLLTYDNEKLFNSERLHQYDTDGQKGFLGYLIRNEKWNIENNKIVFPEINSNEKIEIMTLLYDSEAFENDMKSKKIAIQNIKVRGIDNYETLINNLMRKANEEKQKIINNKKQKRTNDIVK